MLNNKGVAANAWSALTSRWGLLAQHDDSPVAAPQGAATRYRLAGATEPPEWHGQAAGLGERGKEGRNTSLPPVGIALLAELTLEAGCCSRIFTGLGAVQRKHRRGIFLDALCAQRTKPGCGLKAISLLGMFEKLNKGLSFRDLFDMMGCSIFGKMMAISGLSIVAKTPGGACPQGCWSWAIWPV